ncbi:MAG: hypothetical protein Q8L81_18605 [Bacteroidota bacterium]|nr:hypothetical protein [Bacteroidota bacterium]
METTTYIITIEINDSRRRTDFKLFLKTIMTQGYCPIHENAIAVASNLSTSDIFDKIRHKTNSEDRVFIIRSGTEATWINGYGPEHTDWLKKNL